MNKSYIITFSVSILVLFSIAIILLMLLLPQQSSIVKGTIDNYSQIKKSEYTYESTKNISKEPLIKQYTITTDDINKFKAKNQYKAGNADPFTPAGVIDNSGNSNSNNNSGSNNSNNNSNNNNAIKDANDKTTNSNGGIPNPPATNK